MSSTSSAKYHMFEAEKDENGHTTVHKSEQKWLKIGLIVTAVILVSLAIATALAIGVGVGVGVSVNEPSSGLTVATVTQTELEGQYYSSDGSIHFTSVVNDTHVVLTIFTKNGELVATINHPLVTNMTLMSVNKTNFLIMEDQPGRPRFDDYLVPDDMMDSMNSMMMNSEEMTNDLLRRMDNSTVNETRTAVLRELAMSPHAKVIVDAALALGKLGIMGTDYPSVLHFYQFALQLAKMKNTIENEEGNDPNSGTQSKRQSYRWDRQSNHDNEHNLDKRAVRCSNGATCPNYRCPTGSGCFGMCGYGCSCWSFVCGDCCVHEYCRSHDQCCADRGFFSYACLSVAWRVLGSRCSQTYRC